MATDTVDSTVLLEIYRRTARIYHADCKFRQMISTGELAIVYYPVRGQEVLAAAMMTALEHDDYLVTIYRGLHDQIAKGVPLKPLWAEFAGKRTGTCCGKGGPMHITHPESGLMVTTGIVGSGIPIATGLGLASQLAGDGKVTVCSFGDGATNIGAFHEGVNLASLWNLPVIFLCQNNRYGEHTKFEFTSTTETVAERGVAYGIRSVRVDGNDAAQMYAAAREAVEHARAGHGPTLIEAMTFRFNGHVFGDPGKYIPKEELEAAMAADPVPRLREQLLALDISPSTLDDIDAQAVQEVEEAAAFALNSGQPELRENRLDVLSEEILG
ncbi:MAG: thiamine pyrophosphate-dependent dehydrogenase E1 component subunit alpha [Pseudomonadota bacterium]